MVAAGLIVAPSLVAAQGLTAPTPPSLRLDNPYLMGGTYASQAILWSAGQAALPEFAFQVLGTSALGGGDNKSAFKGSIGGFMTCTAGSGDCYGGNFVTTLSNGLSSAVTGIPVEADLNVANADYGDDRGPPQQPYAAALYISGSGPHRATCAICVNYAAGGISFNRGLVFWNGTTNQSTIEDYTDSPNGAVLHAEGHKRDGIDLSAAAMTGSGLIVPNNVPAVAQRDAGGAVRPLIALNDHDALLLGGGGVRIEREILSLDNGAARCALVPTAGALTSRCTSDARLKTDVTASRPALPYLDSFAIRDYTMLADGSRQTGVVAQEIAATHPDMVHAGADGALAVDSINPWLLVKAIQELEQRVRLLEERNRELERRH
jgi:hypothetical protein